MKITITNRIAVLIRERQISSASEFGRRMTAAGFPMSSSHASRYEKESAPAFDLKFMNTACNVLQCLPNELYGITVELDLNEDIDPLIVLPRHANVVHRESSSDSNGKANSEEASVKSLLASTQPTLDAPIIKKTAKGKIKPISSSDEDTGPSGAIFPFLRD